MRRKAGIVALALALLLALAPAAPALDQSADAVTTQSFGEHKALKYIGCAGAIVFMVAVPQSIFFTALICADAFLDD